MRVRCIASVLLFASVANAAEFDRDEAKKSLKKVHVKHCGYGGPGEVRVTFAPTGFVSDVEVYDGKYTENAMRCIERMFHAPVVLAFDGDAQTVKFRIVLPLEKEVVAPKPIEVPRYASVDPSSWRPGHVVPIGYQVEETPHYGVAAGGLVIALAGCVLIAAGAAKGFREDSDMSESIPVVYGGALALGGLAMTLIGLGTHRTELVRK